MITAPTEFSGLQVWLDGSDTTRLFQLSGGTTAVAANLDPVGYWGDKSGNNRHFTNIGGSATTRPTWVSSLSTVRFDGSNDYLSSFFNITYTAQTVFVVVTQRALVAGTTRVYTQAAAGVLDTTYLPVSVPTSTTSYTTNITGTARSSVTSRGLSAYDIFTSTQSSVSALNFLNGTAGSAYGNTINLATTLSRVGVGISNGTTGAVLAGSYFNGDVSEVIVYNRALTNNERADVEYYLTRKWNFLNSIPRQVYGIKNGLWSLTDTWSVSAEPSPWNYPLSADNAYTNTFTITADSSTKVDTIRNSTLAPNILSGGSFWLANGVSLSANRLLATIPITTIASSLMTLLPSATATFTGLPCVNVGTNTSALCCINGHLTVYGNVSGGVTNALNAGTIITDNNSTLFVYGSAIATGAIRYQGSNMNINIFGDVRSTGDQGQASVPIYCPSSGRVNNATLNIVGNLFGSNLTTNAAVLIYFNPGGTITINVSGDLYAGSGQAAGGILIGTSGTGITINIRGNLYGPSAGSFTNDINAYSAALINDRNVGVGDNLDIPAYIKGSLFARNSMAIRGITNVLIEDGTIAASSLSPAIFWTTTTYAVSTRNCNIINAPNGRQAIYAPRYQVFPTGAAQYTRQASNGYDSYVDYWTSNSTFSYPASSDVALGTTYSNSTLSGSMAVPSPSSVALGAFVGTTTGTASMTLDNVLSQPIANLTTPNSIGARLKNITTSQALSAIVDSLEF